MHTICDVFCVNFAICLRHFKFGDRQTTVLYTTMCSAALLNIPITRPVCLSHLPRCL